MSNLLNNSNDTKDLNHGALAPLHTLPALMGWDTDSSPSPICNFHINGFEVEVTGLGVDGYGVDVFNTEGENIIQVGKRWAASRDEAFTLATEYGAESCGDYGCTGCIEYANA